MKIIHVHIRERKLGKGRIAFDLSWTRADGQRKFQLACKSEPNVTARRKKHWEKIAADLAHAKEREMNGYEGMDARDFAVPCLVADAKDLYILAMDGQKAPGTVDNLMRVLGSFVEYNANNDGPKKVSGIRQTHIARWRDYHRDKGLAASTVNTYLADVSGWLKWCLGESFVYDNYGKKVNRIAVDGLKRAEMPVRGADGFWTLLRGLERPADHDFAMCTIGLLACTGLRMDEAAHLKFDEAWDQDNDTLVIGVGMREGKSKKHRRVIPISNILRHYLMALRMIQHGPYIIGTREGYQKMTSQARTWLRPLGCSPKHLRQWFRTALETVCGVKNFPLIDDLMGHRTSAVRAAYTTSEYVEATREIVNLFDKWLTAAKPDVTVSHDDSDSGQRRLTA